MTSIALVGNPNCGKTTLFNALTGTHQRVGNWPGVTVEKKSGTLRTSSGEYTLVDLPGTYALGGDDSSLDEQIAQDYLASSEADIIINVVDATSLARGLYLTNELLKLGKPTIVALTMTDVAEGRGVEVDTESLATRLGCPVVALVASRRKGIDELKALLAEQPGRETKPLTEGVATVEVYSAVDALVNETTTSTGSQRTWTQRIDQLVLNRYAAFPIFLGVMYLMFLFSINIGSAFIDLFDLLGAALFVELPRQALTSIGAPDWLSAFIADGVGGGVQLVATFIPVIGALFLFLSALESTGYMARIAFIVDRALRGLGLPGKAFVPLVVGFGCNIPSVMATRALDSEPDRILTTLMAPYMSCGARLTVYALFAAAFFPTNGQNVVFALYLLGIVVAVLTALAVKRHLLPQQESAFVLEMPPYHLPVLRNMLIQTWQRLKGFVLRAGKAIVVVVIALNMLNSLGTDGSFGNQDSEKSVLSAIGKQITPLFAPMGIEADNWPATVGIFTGIFAKEVVVGTLDALYAPADGDEDSSISELVSEAFASVPANLADLGGALLDPLGLDLGDLNNLQAQAENQEVQINTITAMQSLFDGQAGAFAYLLFILLYIPCVATIGAIYKEVGAFWANFSVLWSVSVAYALAVIAYQVAQLSTTPLSALAWIGFALALCAAAITALIVWGKQRQAVTLIPLKTLD